MGMNWHPRADADPGQQFFRALISEAVQRPRPPRRRT
jgi:hypothetical protein